MIPANVDAGAELIEPSLYYPNTFRHNPYTIQMLAVLLYMHGAACIEKETAMIQNISTSTSTTRDITSRPRQLARSLQAALWAVWTLAVVGGCAWSWRADMLAGRPLNLLGMAINAILVGVIGLIVLTKIEMRLDPWRFLD